jgi:hypothetical protein
MKRFYVSKMFSDSGFTCYLFPTVVISANKGYSKWIDINWLLWKVCFIIVK